MNGVMPYAGAAAGLASVAGSGSALGAAGNDAGSALGIYSGLTSGTPTGDLRALASGARLYGNLAGDAAASAGGNMVGGALGVYGGIKEGGVSGDTQAALGAAQTAAPIAAYMGSAAAPYLAAAGPIGLALAPALYGMSQPAVVDNQYYNNLNNTLNKGPGTGANANVSGSSAEGQQYGQYAASVLGAATQGDPRAQALLAAHGISPTVAVPTKNYQPWQLAQMFGTAPKAGSRRNAAKGGKMTARKKHPNPRIQAILDRGSFRNQEPQKYDYGGYVTPAYLSSSWSPPTNYVDVPSNTYSTFNNQDIFPATQDPSMPIDTNNLVSSGVEGTGDYGGVDTSGGSGGSGGSNGAGSALSSLGSLLRQYGALAPILGAALGAGNKPASAPATPAGYGAIPSIATPTSQRSYTQPNVQNWYTYGQGPEQSFFSNNQLPTIPGVSPAGGGTAPSGGFPQGSAQTQPAQPGMSALGGAGIPTGQYMSPAAGGNIPSASALSLPYMRGQGAMARGGPTFNSQQGDTYVQDPGAGDGTSDDIDAKLSGGEYVMDAGTVGLLGNGSNEAGARALDQLRERVRQHAGKHLVKGKQFMKAKAPEQYLSGSSAPKVKGRGKPVAFGPDSGDT